MTPQEQGQQDALHYLGIGMDKTAVIRAGVMAAKAPIVKRFSQWMAKKNPKKVIREAFIGDPKRLMSEFNEGGFKRLFRAGDKAKRIAPGIMRESMAAPNLLTKALFYGLPAVEAGQIAFDTEGSKGRRIGETAGSALMTAATWKPLGMLGMMATDPIGRAIGGSAGNLGDAAANGLGQGQDVPQGQRVNPNYG